MSYRERRERRAERLRGWSAGNQAKAAAAFNAAHQAVAGIPPGQPILVGHHSEKRHRRDLERHDQRMRRGFDATDKAQRQAGAADTIAHQLETSIYNDDADAVDQLRAKLERLEGERARIKEVNAAIRKHGLAAVMADSGTTGITLSAAERAELLNLARLCPYHKVEERGFPPYALQNLGGNISRVRERIKHLSGSGPADEEVRENAATATARAGLTITATMTTPSRPGKKPRPVWNVTGNLGAWRQSLLLIGGSWYRGAVSFWDDPTATIEAMCAEAEKPCGGVSRRPSVGEL